MRKDHNTQMASNPVVFLHADLDITPHGEMVLRGVLDPKSLHLLKVGDYQREVLPLTAITQLIKALEAGTVPDIELGMRGDDYRDGPEHAQHLYDDVYIIDGLQRVTAAKLMFDRGGPVVPRLGAIVHIKTTEEWERERFRILNMERVKLSPNILLRNWRHDYPAMETLYTLSMNDKSFVMKGRICWQQRMRREELISAATYAKTIARLHSHLSPGGGQRVDQITSNMQKLMDRVGKNVLRDNIRCFFDVIDQAWGVRRVAFKEGAVYMRGAFMFGLARLLSMHTDFWKGERLVVDAGTIRKLAIFPCRDPNVVQLAASSGKSVEMLYMLLVDHVNSGRRTRRLTPRVNDYPIPDIQELETPEEEEPEEETAQT